MWFLLLSAQLTFIYSVSRAGVITTTRLRILYVNPVSWWWYMPLSFEQQIVKLDRFNSRIGQVSNQVVCLITVHQELIGLWNTYFSHNNRLQQGFEGDNNASTWCSKESNQGCCMSHRPPIPLCWVLYAYILHVILLLLLTLLLDIVLVGILDISYHTLSFPVTVMYHDIISYLPRS